MKKTEGLFLVFHFCQVRRFHCRLRQWKRTHQFISMSLAGSYNRLASLSQKNSELQLGKRFCRSITQSQRKKIQTVSFML